MQHRATWSSPPHGLRPALRLVVSDGRLVTPDAGRPVPFSTPEQPMVVSFEGITEAQQHAALAAFPGGHRFQLARTGSR